MHKMYKEATSHPACFATKGLIDRTNASTNLPRSGILSERQIGYVTNELLSIHQVHIDWLLIV